MKTSTLVKAFFLLPAVFACTLATAQDTTGVTEDEAGDALLEEVLVTATRRGEADIMATPISMTKLVGRVDSRSVSRHHIRIQVSEFFDARRVGNHNHPV